MISEGIKVLFAGEGGQGVQAAAEILAKAAFKEGKHASYIPNFGVEQRGGVSLAFVIVAKNPIAYPKFEKANILAIFSDRSVGRIKQYLSSTTKVIFSPGVKIKKFPKVQVALHSKDGSLLSPRVWNVFILGKINKINKIVSLNSLIKAMDERFARQFKKRPELKKLDLEAIRKGAE